MPLAGKVSVGSEDCDHCALKQTAAGWRCEWPQLSGPTARLYCCPGRAGGRWCSLPLTPSWVRHYSSAPNFPGSLCECSRMWKGVAKVCCRFPTAALIPWMWSIAEVQDKQPWELVPLAIGVGLSIAHLGEPLAQVSYECKEKKTDIYFYFSFINQNRVADLWIAIKWR